MLLDEPLRAGLVDWPRLLEVLDRLRDPVLGEPRINLLPDPRSEEHTSELHHGSISCPDRRWPHPFPTRRSSDLEETIERLDNDPVVRRDRRTGLAVVRMLLDEPLRAGLVDWPRLLEVLDRLRDPVLGEPRINLLPDP